MQRDIELILTRQLASYLAMPVFIVDPGGDLVYYNEPAERILGVRYDETGALPASDWSTRFTPIDGDGTPIRAAQLPLNIATTERRPAHDTFTITGADGVRRHIAVTAFPLIGEASRYLGAVAIFWESPQDGRRAW